MGIGDLPEEYKPELHGVYDPARYYGAPDTPFGDVKLGELPKWLSRRRFTPSAISGACSRAWWRWQHKYVQPKHCGMAAFYHIVFVSMGYFYLINYGRLKHHRNYRYH